MRDDERSTGKWLGSCVTPPGDWLDLCLPNERDPSVEGSRVRLDKHVLCNKNIFPEGSAAPGVIISQLDFHQSVWLEPLAFPDGMNTLVHKTEYSFQSYRIYKAQGCFYFELL